MQSANQGNAQAQSDLGSCYVNGVGVSKDIKKAIDLYEKSASQGNVEGLYNLGACYSSGVGVKTDYKKALKYFEQAAKLGHAPSEQAAQQIKAALK